MGVLVIIIDGLITYPKRNDTKNVKIVTYVPTPNNPNTIIEIRPNHFNTFIAVYSLRIYEFWRKTTIYNK